jgi:hypothetical protein
MLSVLNDEEAIAGFRDLGYSPEQVRARVAGFARTFHDTYALGKGADLGWLDKSPRYAEDPALLCRAFPDGLFVVMHRHPLDQVHSFTRGGHFAHPALRADSEDGPSLILRAAAYWRDVTQGLTDFASSVDGAAISITYEALCDRPQPVLESVLQHLDLPWDAEVLNFHRHEHDVGREAGRVAGTKGFSASTRHWLTWPKDWVLRAWEVVRPTAEKLGYRIDEG